MRDDFEDNHLVQGSYNNLPNPDKEQARAMGNSAW
jgi:hypothetical protein